jgi:alkaline phosphatase D
MQDLGTKVVGVWDDHDYGINDGGMEFSLKNETREMFLRFIREPQDSPRSMDKNSPIH